MAYSPTTWVNGSTPAIDATNLNKIEQGIVTLDTALGAVSYLAFNAQTGTSYTLVLGDAGKVVEFNNASAVTVTIPANASVPFVVGTQIHLGQIGAGQVSIVGAGGVTVNGAPGLNLVGQWSYVTLIKRATDTWRTMGRLTS